MSTLYSYEQATGLLADLAANEEVRRQLLADPEATFRKYGFDVDPGEMPARRELANKTLLEDVLRENLRRKRKEEREHPGLSIFLMR